MAEIVYFPTGPFLLNRKTDSWKGAAYIGRPSKWGNPFEIGKDGTREEVIDKFEKHLFSSGLIESIGELEGRNLACWCAPQLCHGHVLLKYANPTLRSAA